MCHMAHIDTKLGCLAAASITAIVLSVIVFSLHLARYEQIPPLNPIVACPSCTPAWPRDMVIATQLAIIVNLLRQDRTQPTGPTSDEQMGHEADNAADMEPTGPASFALPRWAPADMQGSGELNYNVRDTASRGLSTGLPHRRGALLYVAKDPGDLTEPQLLHTLPCCQGPWRLD